MKIFERVLDARLRHIVTITPNQCGFVKGSGTSDVIHAVRILLERYQERDLTIHTSFLDLEKVFDGVPHELIWHSLRSHGVPGRYLRWVKILYKNTTSSVRTTAGIIEPFEINVGVHQGSPLVPILFILCMDTTTADIQKPHLRGHCSTPTTSSWPTRRANSCNSRRNCGTTGCSCTA